MIIYSFSDIYITNAVILIFIFFVLYCLQNKDSSLVPEPLTVPEPTAMRSSEVESSLTSPESGKETSSNRESLDTPRNEEKKKMVKNTICSIKVALTVYGQNRIWISCFE